MAAPPQNPSEAGIDCGPDLDASGDVDFFNFLARAEGLLPSVFAEFDRAAVDLNGEINSGRQLLERSKDLRVLVLYAKLAILDRRLDVFSQALRDISELLSTAWDFVHPRGDAEYRQSILLALDDMPHVYLPLQGVTLFESRTVGRVSYRTILLSTGAIQPRDGEDVLQSSALQSAIQRVETEDLEAPLALLRQAQAAVESMAAAFGRALGAGHELPLPKLKRLLGEQVAWLSAEVSRRSPGLSATTSSSAPEAEAASGFKIQHFRDAVAALDAVASYLFENEPSSLGLLLVRQSRKLAGASFLEAMRALVPDSLHAANIRIGIGSGFSIPLERLSEFEMSSDGSWSDAPETSDGWSNADDGSAPDNAEPDDAMPRTEAPPPQRLFAPASQRDVVELLGAVADYYRSAQPSSPLPILLDRARSLIGREFMRILEDVLPRSYLENTSGD